MQRKTINFTEAEEKFRLELVSLFELHDSCDRSFRFSDEHQDLPLSLIQYECAQVWGIPREDLNGRVNHRNPIEKEQRVCFLAACFWFSNKSFYQIADCVGCTATLVRNSRRHLYHTLQNRRRYCEKFLSLFQRLTKNCQGRLPAYYQCLTRRDPRHLKDEQLIQALVDTPAGRHPSAPQREDFTSERNWLRAVTIWNEKIMIIVDEHSKRVDDNARELQNKIPHSKGETRPSYEVCDACPHAWRCNIRYRGFPLCPQLMKLNNQKHGNGRWWWNKDACIRKESIKLN